MKERVVRSAWPLQKFQQLLTGKARVSLKYSSCLSYGKHSIRYFGPVLWNRLHNMVKQSPSLQSFKNVIRNLDISGILENNFGCYLL